MDSFFVCFHSELSSLRLVSFAMAEFLKTGLYHMQTTCFLGQGCGGGGREVVCETLTFSMAFMHSFLTQQIGTACSPLPGTVLGAERETRHST